jgi:hypothetical protein
VSAIWENEREAYTYSDAVYVAKPKHPAPVRRTSIRTEERIGSLLAGAGIIWTTYAGTVDFAGLWRFQILPPGPLEVCAIGILVWLHAKWRRAVKLE